MFALWSFVIYGAFGNETVEPSETPLKPLVEALEKGGIEQLSSYLDKGGRWPRITTDSLAKKEKITQQKDLVALSSRLLLLLKDRAKAAPSTVVEELESEASLLFSLGERLWQAEGYRNKVLALLCSQLASYRCGKLVILTEGAKEGPPLPEVFKIKDPEAMLSFFISMIPEIGGLSDSGLEELLEKSPATGESWFEMFAKILEIDLDGSSVGERFGVPFMLYQQNPFEEILSSEDLYSLVNHYGVSYISRNSISPALALYLRKGGSLETLIKEQANATKFGQVMKEERYRFVMLPLLPGWADVGVLGSTAETIESSEGIHEKLFGINE